MRTVLWMVVMLPMSGCGTASSTPTAHLAGTVTINGQPIPADADAALSFSLGGVGEPVSVPIVNGRYDSPRTPQGSLTVYFYISRRVGPIKVSERTGVADRDIENLVPPEHAAGMKIEVSGDNLERDFDL